MTRTLELRSGAMALTVAPDLGGAIATLRYAGVDLLRPMPEGATTPLEAACFPLAPYANRIAGGRVRTSGRTATLPPNMAGQPHPLHGDAWLSPWTVEALDATGATLTFSADRSAWPWRYAARQSFRLSDNALTVDLAVTNLDDVEGPFGLGFHPYFPGRETARLTANFGGVWLTDTEHLPKRHVQGTPFADWRRGASLASRRLIDHCHTGWDQSVLIDFGRDLRLRLSASRDFPCLHIYSPPTETFFCLEPVSHRPSAVNLAGNSDDGMRLLAPGGALIGWMKIDATPR